MTRLCYIFLLTSFISSVQYHTIAQTLPETSKFIDLNLGVGDTEGSVAFSFNYDNGLGKKQKLFWGLVQGSHPTSEKISTT